MFKKSLLLLLLALSGVFIIYLYAQAQQSTQLPANKATSQQPMENKLKPCPDSPNCVSTQSTQAAKKRAPLPFSGDPTEALKQLQAIVEAMPRTKLVTAKDNYLHFTFKTWPIPFIDDVEFLLDAEAKVIHYRSASRVGYSDMGVNSKRMAKIAKRWESTQ